MTLKKSKAFTLIEVLIALVILAISLTALVKSSSSNVEDLMYIRDKTVAHWIAMNTMSRVQLHLLKASYEPFFHEETVTALNKSWLVKSSLKKTQIPDLLAITIRVSNPEQKRPLVILDGFKEATK